MEKKENTPLWVFLAFSSISTRRTALLLTYSSFLFSVYCIPWAILFTKHEWLGNVFLIDDWSWLAMMIPITIWYVASLRWMDKNSAWES